ncbi:hypothetical protein MY4038_010329 [Beauveria bassiana]
MSSTLIQVLDGWIDIFQRIEDRVARVVDEIGTLVAHAQTISLRIEDIEKRICHKKACLGPAVSEFMQKVSEAITTTQALSDAQEGAQKAAEVVPQLTELTHSAIDLAGAIPDVDDLIKLIFTGKLRRIQDILEAIQIAKKLPDIVGAIQDAANPIIGLVNIFDGRGGRALELLQEVLSHSWENHLPESMADSTPSDVRAGVLEIQGAIREELELPLRNVTESVSTLTSLFEGVPIKKGQFRFQAGVSSYRRWSTVSMDLPCTRKRRAHYKVAGGFTGSFDYREVYGCPSGEIEIPRPNHHIPYFRFSIV